MEILFAIYIFKTVGIRIWLLSYIQYRIDDVNFEFDLTLLKVRCGLYVFDYIFTM